MEQLRSSTIHAFLAFTAALSLALACSSSGDGDGGGDSPLGQQMALLGNLGDQFVGLS